MTIREVIERFNLIKNQSIMSEDIKIRWQEAYGIIATYPVILKDIETDEPYLFYGKRKIKVSDLTHLDGFEPDEKEYLLCSNGDTNRHYIATKTAFGKKQISPFFESYEDVGKWCIENGIHL